jgi:hypothetical protein
MRAAICILTAIITFGACGEEPRKLVHCGRDLTCVQQAIFQGVAYTRNCAGEPPLTIFGKEVKVCGDWNGCRADLGTTPGSCIAFGAGVHDQMFVSFDSVAWPAGAWSNSYGAIGGQTLDAKRPQSFALKSADYPVPPTTNSDVEFYLNLQFGGGCASAWNPFSGTHSACMRFGIAQTHYGVFGSPLPRSAEFNRWCGITQGGSGISC